MSAEKPLFEVDHPLQAYCVTLEEEQARLTKDVQDLKVTVASQIEEIKRLLSILAKKTLDDTFYQFRITGTDVKEEFRHVVDAVWADLQTLQVLDGTSTQLSETEMCCCSIIQHEAGLSLSVRCHQFVQTFETLSGVRSIFSVLHKGILGKSWQGGGLLDSSCECCREEMYKKKSGEVGRHLNRFLHCQEF